MRRLLPVFWLVFHVGTALAAEELRGPPVPTGDLIKQLGEKDPDKVCAAARELGRRGSAKDALPALKELLKNRNGRVRLAAAEALWRLEHKASDLVPVYVELLTATDADVRAASAWRLGRFGGDARPAVPVLAAALRDESYEVRVQVGQALANLGPVAEPALPALVRALGDPHLEQPTRGNERRVGIHSSPATEGVHTSPALPALVELADKAIPLMIENFRKGSPRNEFGGDSEERRQDMALMAARAFPAFGARVVPPLLRALASREEDTRGYAAFALREIARLNGLPDDAIDKLEKCLDDPDKSVREAAADAVLWVRPSNTKAVKMLAQAREDRIGGDSDWLTDLERLSPHNEAARKLLLKMLGAERAETAQAAYRILAKLDLPAEQELPVWIKALSHSNQEVRKMALRTLEKLGPNAKSAKPALHNCLATKTIDPCKAEILDALTAIDPDDKALVPLLIKSVDDPDSWVSYRALNCLEKLGPKAEEALPALKESLGNPKSQGEKDLFESSKMRDLVGAIVHIDPGSAKTAAILLKALRNEKIRAVHDPKNSWFMRARLEDELYATLPAAKSLLREALQDKDSDVRQSAALVLLRAGLDADTALPVLMDNLLSENDNSFNEKSRFRWRAFEVLARRTAVSRDVAAAWCKVWQTTPLDRRGSLERGLLVLQPEALPHLLTQLREVKNADAKRDLAQLLARFEGQGKLIVPILREELRERSLARQYAAEQSLILIGPDGAEAVPELVELLGSSHPAIRGLAAQALANMGGVAKAAVPTLKTLLKDSNPETRLVSAMALSRIDPDVEGAMPVLRDELLRGEHKGPISISTEGIDSPELTRGHTIEIDSVEEGIMRYGDRSIQVLADILDDGDLDNWGGGSGSTQGGATARVRAALLLAKLGPDAAKAVPSLVRALDDRDLFIREAALSALGRIGPTAKEAAPACLALLERRNRQFSAGAWTPSSRTGQLAYGADFDFRNLGRRGSRSAYYDDYYAFRPNPYAQLTPAYPYDPPYVLSRIDGKERSALPVLREMAKDPNHPDRLPAALALWHSGDDSPDLVRAVEAALAADARTAEGRRPSLSREIRDCLAETGTQIKPSAEVLVGWLKKRQAVAADGDQIAIIRALARLGADARPHAELLRPMLRSDRWDQRRRAAAALALYRILGDKESAYPVLRDVLGAQEEHATIYYWPDRSDAPRVHAAQALAVLAEKGDERARALLADVAKGDENPYVRLAALEGLARLKDANGDAVTGLCALLRHPDEDVRVEAALACGRLGPLAKTGAKGLRAAAKDGHLAVRQAARQALEAQE